MFCFGLLLFMWCDAEQQRVPVDSFCQLAKPVYWAAADTRQTKEQVDRHNRVFKAICQVKK